MIVNSLVGTNHQLASGTPVALDDMEMSQQGKPGAIVGNAGAPVASRTGRQECVAAS
ncbi:MAG: hypothetical protein WC000_08535 [Dokdonella sp.]|jgi:hypothetical protein